jgi:hypothetical protein
MKKVALAGMAAALCFASVSADARRRHSDEDNEKACKPDVFRLCHEAIPSQSRIVACLKQKRKLLRPACRKVMSR